MMEFTQSGNVYSIWLEYDGYGTNHKARGKKELNELIDDLIHDVKIDEQFHLVAELENIRP